VVHASNVIGNLLPIGEIGSVARNAGIPFLVDASQTAGACPIDVETDHIDMLAFTGHKSPLGPTGTGGLYVRHGSELRPLVRGGTGSRSEEEYQPDFMPDKLESGTLNVVGLAGLGASVRFLLDTGINRVREHECALIDRFLTRAADLPELIVYGPEEVDQRAGLLSFNIKDVSPSRVGLVLDRAFGIMTRIGLHCAPAAHHTMGTYPHGTIRFGFSYFNSLEDVDYSIEAIQHIIQERKHG
jgi:selenocysteine lyase/cysteine desulfurase